MKPEYRAIHEAIHNPKAISIEIDGYTYPIRVFKATGIRYVEYDGYQFTQQNPKKNSDYAARARGGERITWGIRRGPWLLIED